MNKKILASLFAVGLAAGYVCSSVDAHGVFFANRTDEKVLVLGEGPVEMCIRDRYYYLSMKLTVLNMQYNRS